MKFTAKEEYGLRCLLTLARAQSARAAEERTGDDRGNPAGADGGKAGLPRAVTVAEIASAEGLSVQNAGKLVRILGKAGLVESVRGCKGGYRLVRPAAELPVSEILAALGGILYEPATCGRYSGGRQRCVHTNDCSIRSLWAGLQHVVERVLGRVSLADLMDDEQNVTRWVQVYAEDVGVLSSHEE